MTQVWPFTNMKVGEKMTWEIPIKTKKRRLFRSALGMVKIRKGFAFQAKYIGRTITVERTK